MKVIIRTDASIEIGSGHVMRCLTVAKNLRLNGCEVIFWMQDLSGNLIDYVNSEGFGNIFEAEHADLYIIDHYGIDIEWESKIRLFTKKIVVIDDLANRRHDCELLLDQNALPNFESRYDGLVSDTCVKLLGPKYLIMRDEFIDARRLLRKRQETIENLLIFMGGSDPTNETIKILKALEDFQFKRVDVVVGNGNVFKEQIRGICEEQGYYYHCQINYMAKLMQQADFAIGAGGSTTWERCYVGLPSSSTIVASNQREGTEYSAELGLVINLGWHSDVTSETYKQLLKNIKLKDLSKRGLTLTQNEQPNAWVYKILELIK
ncbi:UDP-2,4-diacetamido-2,4,6-trideoxy-beta-L-altropyranose hydrolase [Lysinibacillus capsici]|uniref:UDP-2,4-diacetamido-2,4, 6-trideoxy-beta-L-altropyranose hydrolase n=1 Tax=Lysinibacillus capsici TaxID=2115968 RepID=UPI0028BDCA52|nr:UDP-2,4-diacetamido-2,4,6-trideoxy-beta-L-altropyranose hydrolase [Lysinibacillus capsici]WNN76934.1 UDP-2,4-diacetamido-2,4,6-trideoxy-beta-L-altropyranose hydrolase [Lysinibacillus capsici]WPK06112.1 UDP-2,4-diacetamido-2,4,6-trideoxy-beta-L-altropyranose hydrolase [Lysinibacillus capsici]